MYTSLDKKFILQIKQLTLLAMGLAVSACNTQPTMAVADTSASAQRGEAELQILRVTYGTDPNAEKWFTYNAMGDLVRQAVSIDTVEYQYLGQKIEKRHIQPSMSWQSKVVYALDKIGRVSNSTSYDQNGQEISTCAYSYNADGYLQQTLEKVIASKSTYVNTFEYLDGNLTRVTVSNNGKITSYYGITYHAALKNNLNLCLQQISEDVFPNDRMGKKNSNQIQQIANVSVDGDTLSLLQYQYPKPNDSDELIVIEKDVLNEMETKMTYHFKQKK